MQVKYNLTHIELSFQLISCAEIHVFHTSMVYHTMVESFSALVAICPHHQQYLKKKIMKNNSNYRNRKQKIKNELLIKITYRPASLGGRMLDKNTFLMSPFAFFTLMASPLNTSTTVPAKSFSRPVND